MSGFGPTGRLHAPMTVMQVIPHLDTGGAEQTCIEIAEALVAGGHRALVAGREGRLNEALAAVGGEFLPFNGTAKSPLAMSRNARTLTRFIRQKGVHIVHARSRAPGWSARSAARRRGVVFVTTYHGIYSENSWVKKAYNRVMASGDMVIANSGFTADLIRQRYRTPEKRLCVINRCFDPEIFDPGRFSVADIAATRHAWGLRPGQKAIVLAGRLTSWKGQAVLLRAAALLKGEAAVPPFAVVLVGDDQGRDGYRNELFGLVAELGLDGSVHMVGHSSKMAQVFAAADLVVSASTRPEAFGRVAVEAQAMARPVIVSDLGPVHETVRAVPDVADTEKSGWIVPPDDPEALANALAEALALPAEALSAIGVRGRIHVNKSYTKATMTAATLSVYEELMFQRQLSTTFS
ncbi:Glycosyltransferase [hydrothermal vent metagenome]|uniref:Glycosyltransferase n=1 Tax=hydrothermal vent metagenome TaxID=652676 RepID=A0A3B0TEX0_9ZZZZ